MTKKNLAITLCVIIGIVGIIYFAYNKAAPFLPSTYKHGCTESGKKLIEEQTIVIEKTDHVLTPTCFFGQTVVFKGSSDSSVSIYAQSAKVSGQIGGNLNIFTQSAVISGHISGDVNWTGQTLAIDESGRVDGDVNVGMGQVLTIDGIVGGKVTGSMQEHTGGGTIVGGFSGSTSE